MTAEYILTSIVVILLPGTAALYTLASGLSQDGTRAFSQSPGVLSASLLAARPANMPGFVSFKAFTAEDDQRISVIDVGSTCHERETRRRKRSRDLLYRDMLYRDMRVTRQ